MTPGKRLFDILFSLYLMAFLAPVIAVVTWKCWRQQGRPIFYGSERMRSPTEACASRLRISLTSVT